MKTQGSKGTREGPRKKFRGGMRRRLELVLRLVDVVVGGRGMQTSGTFPHLGGV